MAAPPEPMEQRMFYSPELLAHYRGLHTNSVLLYFGNSLFCDPMSNNAIITSQAQLNQHAMGHLLESREAFEARLKTMSGLEYLVESEPEKTQDGGDTGVWVIKKQDRQKRANLPDQTTLLGIYYIVNEKIYMAPTLYQVLQARVTQMVHNLNSIVTTARDMVNFDPAEGYTWVPPSTEDAAKTQTLHSTTSSRAGSPAPDDRSQRENSVGLGRHIGLAITGRTTTEEDAELRDPSLLAESWDMLMRHGNEFMDENPLTGEPGNFKFTSSVQQVQQKREKNKAEAAAKVEAVKKAEESRAVSISAAATPKVAGSSKPPLEVKTTIPIVKADGSAKSPLSASLSGGVKKRKKRNPLSPSSPGTPGPIM